MFILASNPTRGFPKKICAFLGPHGKDDSTILEPTKIWKLPNVVEIPVWLGREVGGFNLSFGAGTQA